MEHLRFTEQQIAFVLEQVARGASIEQTCRNAGISVQTYYRWRAKYAGLKPADIRRLHQIEEENKRLKRLLAALLVVKPAPGTAAQSPALVSRALVPVPGPAPAAASTSASLAMNRYWQSLSGYLPKMPGRDQVHVGAKARALLTSVQAWTAAQAKELRKHSAGALAAKLWVWLGKTWRVRKLLIICFAGGVIGGFAIGLAPAAKHEAPTMPVNMNVRVNSYGSLTSTMDKGWGRPETWGRWMEGASASMLLGFDGPARGDVELLVEGRARLAPGQPDQILIVRFNDTELGRWRLPKESGRVRRRFIVPNAAFNQSTAAHLTFSLAERAPLSAVFGLEAVSLRDARFLHDYRGFVDSCTNNKLIGWAMAEGTAVNVVASVDGKPLAATLTSITRADLAKQGLPSDAGYELLLAEPVAPGSAIDVHFPGGRSLIGSPCKPQP